MRTAVTLSKQHYTIAVQTARELDITPQAYIESLIDAADLTFDEILAPVRKSFAASGATEEQLDKAVVQARKAIRSRSVGCG